jgi:SAM-dependent methyltransferase
MRAGAAMNETSKSRKIWGALEQSVLTGKGIDIGCGGDPVSEGARGFDLADGDANVITRHVQEQFDFVYSSHCLEHMREPAQALREWWELVRPGGHLFFVVPDEDLYEQGVFPSRFNPDHKGTFTISKTKSWSPVSHNVLELAQGLPNGELVSLKLQDDNYDRRRQTFGPIRGWAGLAQFIFRVYNAVKRRTDWSAAFYERWMAYVPPVDQTKHFNALAQIQCIVKKVR